MRILLLHAFYQQLGGEDLSFRAEEALLRSQGEDVETLCVENREVDDWSALEKAARLFWHRKANARLETVLKTFRPDVLHIQNTFPGFSPSVIHAAARHGVPVVQKLSNYRMFCVNGTFFRSGKPCESCLGSHLAWRAAVHGCYRDNRLLSGTLAAATGLHWALGTWSKHIHAYVALDHDGRDRFIEAGLEPSRVHVKPNFLDPFPAAGAGQGGYALFAGRLSQEKGAATLIDGWKSNPALPELRIAGDGPDHSALRVRAGLDSRIRFLGQVQPDMLRSLMADAALVVVPSEFREPFGRVALEALGVGTPVLSSRAGALQHIVRPGINGAHFETGSAVDLATQASTLFSDRVGLTALRSRAREDAMERFSGAENYRILMSIYAAARREAGKVHSSARTPSPEKPEPHAPDRPPSPRSERSPKTPTERLPNPGSQGSSKTPTERIPNPGSRRSPKTPTERLPNPGSEGSSKTMVQGCAG